MCNGLAKRFNDTSKLMLKRVCAKSPRDRDRYVGSALFAYRDDPQESSMVSQFELLYGSPVRGAMTILKDYGLRKYQTPSCDQLMNML